METASIFLAYNDDGTRRILEASLLKLGHRLQGVSSTTAAMISRCVEDPPDLIITGTRFADGDGIEALIEISKTEPRPAIIITDDADLSKVEDAMDDHVMAFLIEPVTPDDLKPTILVVLRRFAQFQELRKENENLRGALETRKKLERAKGILMVAESLTEEESYLRLRDMATSRRIRIGEVAEEVIAGATE